MSITSDPQADATIAAIAAALPLKPSNPQGTSEAAATSSPQIKPEHIPDVDNPTHDGATLPPMPTLPTMLPVPPMPAMPHPTASQRAMPKGPSPQKGSGQERFRQMISGRPLTTYPQLPGLQPPGTAQLLPSTGYYQGPASGPNGHVAPSRAASGNPSSLFFTDTSGGAGTSVEGLLVPSYKRITADKLGMSRADSQPPSYQSASATNKNNDGYSTADNNLFRTTHTSILSSECQSRRFNPQFTEWVGSNGKYYASVRLQNHTISDGRGYNNTMDAKQSLAKQAVDWIRANMRKEGAPTRAEVIAKEKQEMLNRERAGLERHNGGYGSSSSYGGTGGNGLANGGSGSNKAGYSHYSPGRDRASRGGGGGANGAVADHKKSEAHVLLAGIRSLYGHYRGPSEAVLADPVASRAYLQGFALGEKLRDSAVRAEGRRSRSPKAGGDPRSKRNYRERSATRRLDSSEHR
ncbi:hypothetical protein PG999_010192 [Apiospora kogelbergensis]|uniref:AP2 domain-containing protein n=1 Tax=Apiospora kogelbergensis TaxID=1337665 RepID=A0AAW0QF34_9PEZI